MIEVETILIFLMMFMLYLCYQYPKLIPILVLNEFMIIIFVLDNWVEIHEWFGISSILIAVILNTLLIFSAKYE